MRRWNGWGDDATDYPLDEAAIAFLGERVGASSPLGDTTLETALAAVPDSRLAKVDGLDCGAETRLRHARGESFPDWLAKKSGRLGPFPDAVAQPASHDEVVALLDAARRGGWQVIPWAGGTSVVGHLAVPSEAPPVLSLDLGRMDQLTALDEHSALATFGAGTPGPRLEAQLGERGWRLGHFPQSWEYSTVGGWVVTRSSGQQSLAYGRIEQLFAGGRLAAPAGELPIPCLPASSAGPDLRELVLGSEGRLGVLTEATVRLRRLPACERFLGLMFPDWDSAQTAVRELAHARPGLSMLRLSNVVETETQLALAGHAGALRWLQRYLGLRGIGDGQCLLMVGISGSTAQVNRSWRETKALCGRHGGVALGAMMGRGWAANRFRGPYLRNSLWAAGYGADTIETAVNWPQVTPLMNAMEAAAREAFAEDGERVHAFTHLSHVYPQGSSIYSTFVFRATDDVDQMLERWRRFKSRVSEQIVRHGGTISHQHGVGEDHKAWLEAEKSPRGLALIRALAREMDPAGQLNPGKLLD